MPDLVLYDGHCGLCRRSVQFLLARDRHDRLRFASLQSDRGQSLLKGAGLLAEAQQTFFVVADYETERQRLLSRSTAALHALGRLGGFWRLAAVCRLCPRFLRDAVYGGIATRRYRWFGRSEHCHVPTATERAKFLDS